MTGTDGTSTPNGLPPQQIPVSAEAKTLIRSLLTVDESQRPSAMQVLLSSGWLQQFLDPAELGPLQTEATQFATQAAYMDGNINDHII